MLIYVLLLNIKADKLLKLLNQCGMSLPGSDELRAAFFDKSNELFTLFDKDLNLIDANEAALALFRAKKEDVVGRNLLEILPGFKGSSRYRIYKEVLRTGRSVQIEDLTLHPSLGNLRLRVDIFKVGDGIGVSSTNITDLKETIEELDQFTYRLSHDLRGPLARIAGLINVADYEVKNAEDARDFRAKMRDQVNSVTDILNRLSDTMRIRKGEKIISLVNFREIIQKVYLSLAFMKGYDEVKIEYQITTKRKIYSDRFLLKTILENLVENAIKYKRDDNHDSFVRIVVADDTDEGVMITVTDNGIGIPDKLQARVFDMFFRATNKAKGTGLGLYTTKHSVKKLGGSIFLDSIENVGTTVTIFLPPEKPSHENRVMRQVLNHSALVFATWICDMLFSAAYH
jgi:PAS domain S-box-containing protein